MKGKVRIISAFCACIGLLMIVGVYSYFNTHRYNEASQWVQHSQELIRVAGSIFSNAQTIETSQRGYVISGEISYLRPLDNAISESKDAYRRSKELTSDNHGQQQRLEKIEKLLEKKIDFSRKVVNLRSVKGFDAAQQLIATRHGEKVMQAIRQEIAGFTAEEERLLDQRLVETQERFQEVITTIIISVVFSIVILIVALYFFIKDHNRRVKSEREVKESEQRMKSVLEVMPIGVFVVKANGRPYFANHVSAEILGYDIHIDKSLSEIRRQSQTFYMGTDEPFPESESPVQRALMGERVIGYEDMEILRDGRRVQLRVNAAPLYNSEGDIEYVVSLFEDISIVKMAEKELVEAKRIAEEALVLKETFLANMSHEIRTPMNAILGFTDLLMKESLDDKERDYVNIIRTSGENLLRIINDILDLSKMEANMMVFERQPISIQDVFKSLNTMLAHRAKEKRLELTFECDDTMPSPLMGDPTRLTQIIINLVGNAIKFTKKGSVTVKAHLLEEQQDQCEVEFSIADTGIGIPKDQLQGIFERFRQADTNTTRHYGGTGLGLSIAKQLVELQGGTIRIDSEVDKGSVFTFVLTFGKADEHQRQELKKKDDHVDYALLRKMNIVLAEDNPINVKLVENLFATEQIAIHKAMNGQEVLEIMKREPVDLILMDLEMPVMNGYETTRTIREDLQSDVPIIAMTAHAMAGEQERCLQLGMNDFVSKPINSRILFAKMHQIAQSHDPRTHREVPADIPVVADEPEKLFDLNYLKELSNGNKVFEKEMIDLFLSEVPVEMERMKKAYAEADFVGIKGIAHKLKSSIPVVGANQLLPLLRGLEEVGMSNELSELSDELFNTLIAQLEECCAQLRELMANGY